MVMWNRADWIFVWVGLVNQVTRMGRAWRKRSVGEARVH